MKFGTFKASDAHRPPRASDTAPVERGAPLPASAPGASSFRSPREGAGVRLVGPHPRNLLERIVAKHFGPHCAYENLAAEQVRLQLRELGGMS